MTKNEMTDAELDQHYTDLCTRHGIPRGATFDDLVAMSAAEECDVIGRSRHLFAPTDEKA